MRINKMLLSAALALMACGTVQAATDGYREALKQMLMADSVTTAMRKMQVKMFVAGTLARSRHGVSSEDAMRLEKSLDKYIATQFADDMVDIVMPCYRENVSGQQLSELAALMSRPDIRRANAHMTSLSAGMMKNIGPALAEAFSALKEGRKPTLPKQADCTEAYKQKFEEYWQSGGIEQVMTSTVDKILSNVPATVETGKAKAVVNFVIGLTKALMLNEFVGNVTEAELDSIIELTRSGGYRAQLNAVTCMASDPMKMLKDMEAAFVNWAKANGEAGE